eukprot:scaffold3155_cov97-Skeletonema_dohrnii-CCMP3373.AAC.3
MFHRAISKEKHISKQHSENLACGWVDAGSPACTLCIRWWTRRHQYLTENTTMYIASSHSHSHKSMPYSHRCREDGVSSMSTVYNEQNGLMLYTAQMIY